MLEGIRKAREHTLHKLKTMRDWIHDAHLEQGDPSRANLQPGRSGRLAAWAIEVGGRALAKRKARDRLAGSVPKINFR